MRMEVGFVVEASLVPVNVPRTNLGISKVRHCTRLK